jgi:hypothetical protein
MQVVTKGAHSYLPALVPISHLMRCTYRVRYVGPGHVHVCTCIDPRPCFPPPFLKEVIGPSNAVTQSRPRWMMRVGAPPWLPLEGQCSAAPWEDGGRKDGGRGRTKGGGRRRTEEDGVVPMESIHHIGIPDDATAACLLRVPFHGTPRPLNHPVNHAPSYAPHADSTRATKEGVGGWSCARAALVDSQLRKSDVRISTIGDGVQGGIPAREHTMAQSGRSRRKRWTKGHSTHGISHRPRTAPVQDRVRLGACNEAKTSPQTGPGRPWAPGRRWKSMIQWPG